MWFRARDWHNRHPHVYEAFKKYSFEMIHRGIKKSSHWMVMNRVRWEAAIETGTSESFKIPNDFIAYYARMFMDEFPEHEGFFELRSMPRHEKQRGMGQWTGIKET
jgi:hypothetical protein